MKNDSHSSQMDKSSHFTLALCTTLKKATSKMKATLKFFIFVWDACSGLLSKRRTDLKLILFSIYKFSQYFKRLSKLIKKSFDRGNFVNLLIIFISNIVRLIKRAQRCQTSQLTNFNIFFLLVCLNKLS